MGMHSIARVILPANLRYFLGRLRGTLKAAGISTDYKLIDARAFTDVALKLQNSWKDETIPEKQLTLVQQQLMEYSRGKSIPVFDALVNILKDNISDLNSSRLLEIGCSSGYYSQVLEMRNVRVSYSGCDLSEPFVQLAQKLYPCCDFQIQDATRLTYQNSSFRIVVSGCCILHIADYEKAIAEAARVSSEYVVFHRTPILHTSGPVFYEKKAYGIDTFEIHFHEQTLLKLFRKYGLSIVDINTQSTRFEQKLNDAVCMKTYLLTKGLK